MDRNQDEETRIGRNSLFLSFPLFNFVSCLKLYQFKTIEVFPVVPLNRHKMVLNGYWKSVAGGVDMDSGQSGKATNQNRDLEW